MRKTPTKAKNSDSSLHGNVVLHIGEEKYRVRKGDSFCFKPASVHWIQNTGKTGARLIWVATPPSF